MQKKIFKFGFIGILLLFIGILIIIFLVPDAKFDAALVFPSEVSENMKNEVLIEFEKKKIPYKVKKGIIYYPKQYDQFALKVSDEVIFGKDSGPGMKLTDLAEKEYFIELLEKAKIPYRIKKYRPQGDEWILWSIEDDDRVQDLELKALERMGVTKQPARMRFSSEKDRELFASLLNKEKISFRLVEEKIGQESMLFIEYDWKDYKKLRKIENRIHQNPKN